MARNVLAEIDSRRLNARDSVEVEAAKVCRITLSKDAPSAVELPWCAGRGHKRTLIILRPGATVEQPVDKARAWFGPFDLYKVYEECTDEKELDRLAMLIKQETDRYLYRYDYPRESGEGYKPKMTETGPHRSPDVTITILNSDGSEDEPIELHKVYGIGKYDDKVFAESETVADIQARYEAQLAAKEEKVDKLEGHVRELTGLVKGFVAGKATVEAPAAAPEAAAV